MAYTSRVIFLSGVLIGALGCRAARPEGASLRDAWLQAPKSLGAKWNRQPLLSRLLVGMELKGMPRAKVLGLLGQPGFSVENYPERSKIDEYRLSAANDRKFRVDYDSGHIVTGYFIESIACGCDYCTPAAPVLAATVLEKSGLTRMRRPESGLTMSAFESMLDRPGQLRLLRASAGSQLWLNYDEIWRVASAPEKFLIVSGHVPARNVPGDAVADQQVLSWATISVAPQCLAQ